MKWLIATSLVVLVGVLAVSANQRGSKPVVQVYYESLCPDSKRFIQRQLYPLKTSPIGDYFYVDLIPYGKASTSHSGGSYHFNCQHGAGECKGNKLHACAIQHLNETQSLEFVYCSMGSSYPPNSLDECSSRAGVGSTARNDIQSCSNSDDSSDLLAKNGERTHSLSPKLYFVPWLTFNGVFNEKQFQQSLSDFKTVMCRELHNSGQTPEGCEGITITTLVEEAKQMDDGKSGSLKTWLVHQPYLVQFLAILLTFHNILVFTNPV